MKLFRLDDKVAVITGGSGVLGGAMARGLAQAGARIAVLGREEEGVVQRVDELKAAGAQALPLTADVLDRTDLESARRQVLDEWGRIDILINAAGGNRAGAVVQPDASLFGVSVPDFEQVVSLNLTGTLLPILVFGEVMAAHGQEAVVLNISSMAAQQPLTRVMGYSASKAAIDNLTKWLSVEMATKYGPHFRVNALAPGFFVGEQNRRLLYDEQGELSSRGRTIVAHTPMKRFGEPEELIGATLWLCSPASAFVTGIVVPVDGGFSAFSGV